MEPGTVTPADLARELGVTSKSVRDVLRAHYGTLTPPATRWRVTDEQARAVRQHFAR